MSIINHIDQRNAPVAIIGLVLSTGMALWSQTVVLEKEVINAAIARVGESGRTSLSVTPTPAVWAHFPQAISNRLIAIDAFIENPPSGLDPVVIAAALLGSAQPQLANVKRLVALAIVDRRRASLLPAIIASLTAQATPDLRNRAGLASLLRKYVALHGPTDFTPPVTSGLLQVYGNLGTSPTVLRRVLSRVLSDLGVNH